MSAFAGFWVDGAVRLPEANHCTIDGEVLYRLKNKAGKAAGRVYSVKSSGLDMVTNDCCWLDTTPRESLTPEELFSVLKVLWPECKSVFDPGNDADVDWQVQRDEIEAYTPVEWNGIGVYPPPVEPQWIRITRENVGQYLFRLCRCREFEQGEWRDGHIVGWCIEDECCLVDSDEHERERILTWNFVEVQNAPTS